MCLSKSTDLAVIQGEALHGPFEPLVQLGKSPSQCQGASRGLNVQSSTRQVRVEASGCQEQCRC